MGFTRNQLVKYAAATAAGPTNSALYGSLMGGSYADRIRGLNPASVPYADRSYMASSPQGQQLAASYGVDISPATINSMRAQRQPATMSGGLVSRAPAQRAPARTAVAPAGPDQVPVMLNIQKPGRVARQDTSRKAMPGAPAAPATPAPAPTSASYTPAVTMPASPQYDTSKPVVF